MQREPPSWLGLAWLIEIRPCWPRRHKTCDANSSSVASALLGCYGRNHGDLRHRTSIAGPGQDSFFAWVWTLAETLKQRGCDPSSLDATLSTAIKTINWLAGSRRSIEVSGYYSVVVSAIQLVPTRAGHKHKGLSRQR